MSASLASGSFRPVGVFPAVLSSFARYGRWVWRGLEALGNARARAHMLQTAARYDDLNPERAQLLRQAAKGLSPGAN